MEELRNPNYEIPSIGGEIPETKKTEKSQVSYVSYRKSKNSNKSFTSNSRTNVSSSLLDQTYRDAPVRKKQMT